ncbi:MAG: hypothetical protein KIH89_001080 [Candidatus Shapirobacteria bacterium]|nr:hypothetical protein [Candidatus Shapirobacteria bacterium]
MAEFKRSRLDRKNNEQITKKTVFLGFITIVLAVVTLVFGLPLLIKLSVFLGQDRNKKQSESEIKKVPPIAPRLIIPYEATNSGEIKVSGFAEAKVTVELFKNDVSVGKTEVTENGDFTFDKLSLNEGENKFTAMASTEESGSGDDSKALVVVYDKKAPELILTNPSEENLTVDYADFDIIGKSESGSSVSVNNRIASIDNEGNFKLKWQLNTGKNELEVTVRDLAGNETKKKIVITYSL